MKAVTSIFTPISREIAHISNHKICNCLFGSGPHPKLGLLRVEVELLPLLLLRRVADGLLQSVGGVSRPEADGKRGPGLRCDAHREAFSLLLLRRMSFLRQG